jgi:hypothetical protein
MQRHLSHDSEASASDPGDLTEQPRVPLEVVLDRAEALRRHYLDLIRKRDARIAALDWRLLLDLAAWKPDKAALQ